MNIDIDQQKLNALIKQLNKIGIDSDKAIQSALKKSGNQVAKEARSRAPKDTGQGAKSIRAKKETRKKSKYYQQVYIGPDTLHKYMLFPEYGTEKQSSQWFVHGALDDKESDVFNTFESELRKIVQ